MIKRIVAKLAKMCGLKVKVIEKEDKKYVPANVNVDIKEEEIPTPKQYKTVPRTERYEHTKVRPKEEMNRLIEEINGLIITEGYREIPSILSRYEVDVIEHFVRLQLIALGEYSPESDNLESCSYSELIDMAVQNNYEQYKRRMIESGRAGITDAQKRLLERLLKECKDKDPSFSIKTPRNKFEASEAIEYMNKFLGRDNENFEERGITSAQERKLEYLCSKLGKAIPACKTAKEAYSVIAELQAEYDREVQAGKIVEEVKYATQSQLEYMKRLYKLANKRWTKMSAAKYMKYTVQEMSKALQEMKEKIEQENPEINKISEGQKQYIISLCSRMNIPYNVDDISKLTKQQATKKIDELRRKLVVLLSRVNDRDTITLEEVNKMSQEQVKQLLNNLLMERKTNFYEDSPEVVDNKYKSVQG